MSEQTIQQLATATQQGELTFPQVVKELLQVGVESYLVDFAARRKTHYLSNGSTCSVPMILQPGPIAAAFDATALIAAIRAAQADTVRYPEFVQRASAAGVIAYWAFLTGKQVVYFGRQGEQHIEKFPKP